MSPRQPGKGIYNWPKAPRPVVSVGPHRGNNLLKFAIVLARCRGFLYVGPVGRRIGGFGRVRPVVTAALAVHVDRIAGRRSVRETLGRLLAVGRVRGPRAFVRLVRLPGLPFVRRFARVRRGLVAQRVDLGAGCRLSSVVGARGLGLGAAFSSQCGKPGFPRRLIVAGVLHVGSFHLVRGWAGSAFLGGLAGAFLRPLKGGLSVFP